MQKLERLSYEFFTLLPKRLGVVWIERIWAYTTGHGLTGYRVGHDLRNVAIFAIFAADLIMTCNDTGQYRSCGSLRNRLPPERCLALGRELPIPLFDNLLYLTRINVTGQFGLYHSWMHSGSADRTIAVPFVEC